MYVVLKTDTFFPLYLTFKSVSVVGAAVWGVPDCTVQVSL